MEADYVIVGAGAAGCVLAARLSEDPTISVLLLESGGRGRHLLLRIPKAFYLTMQHPEYAYFYPTGSVSPGGPDEVWLRGKGLGGSTAVNGMMYIRGWAADYDRLAAAGDPGWGWAGMLPVFRAMEDHELGASLLRGVGGPLHVSVTAVADPVVAAMLRSATAAGLADVDDFNASDAERIGRTPVTIHRGVRISAATAFLRPARRRRNLTVLDRTHVGHVTLEGGRAVGVVARRCGERLAVRARREVILAAGSIESPQLLERSGIGDPVVLTRAGVEPRVESPHVGERLLEHRGMTVQARLRPGLGLNRRLNTLPRQLFAGAGYVLTRRGPVATGPYDLVGQLRSAPGEPRPDVQILLTPMSLDLGRTRLRLARHAGMMIQGYQLRPTTPSAVHIRSADPADPPVIEARYLETELDRTVTGRILARLRGMMAEGPLADLVIGEDAPGPDVVTPEQAVEYARATGIGIYHAVGSCAMGPNDDGCRRRPPAGTWRAWIARGGRLGIPGHSIRQHRRADDGAGLARRGPRRRRGLTRTPPHPTRDDLDDCWPNVAHRARPRTWPPPGCGRGSPHNCADRPARTFSPWRRSTTTSPATPSGSGWPSTTQDAVTAAGLHLPNLAELLSAAVPAA